MEKGKFGRKEIRGVSCCSFQSEVGYPETNSPEVIDINTQALGFSICLGSRELVVRPGNLGPFSGSRPSTILRHIPDPPSHRPFQPQKNEGRRKPNNRVWLTTTANPGKAVNPEGAEVRLEHTQGLGVSIHLRDHPTPRSSPGTSRQVCSHTHPLKCSEVLAWVCCAGRRLQGPPGENAGGAGPELVVHARAAPGAHTLGAGQLRWPARAWYPRSGWAPLCNYITQTSLFFKSRLKALSTAY